MTIEHETPKSSVNAGKVFCPDVSHNRGSGEHFALIHHGYGESEPLDKEELQTLEDMAQKHDKETKGKHTVKVMIFQADP